MLKRLVIVIMLFPLLLPAQDDNVLPYSHITLDSVVISAVQKGLDIGDLIKVMQFDSTLYMAYNNLYFINYTYTNDLIAYDKRRNIDAEKYEVVSQIYDGKCRTQTIEKQEITGKYYNRRGKPKFYTAELFDKTLYNETPVCGEKPQTNYTQMVYGSKTEGHLGAIKRVIFNPGSPVDLPIIGNKFAIFEPQMQQYYDYSITREMKNGEEYFVFSVHQKPEYEGDRKTVVVRNLVTTFRKSDFQIVSRKYQLRYLGMLAQFDINMEMVLKEIKEKFYPQKMVYRGYFNIPTKRPERIDFTTEFEY